MNKTKTDHLQPFGRHTAMMKPICNLQQFFECASTHDKNRSYTLNSLHIQLLSGRTISERVIRRN